METCMDSSVSRTAEAAKLASAVLASMNSEQRKQALLTVAKALEENADVIEQENKKDLDAAKAQVAKGELKDSLFQRLKLDKAKLAGTISGIRQIAEMVDPVGKVSLARELDERLNLYRIACPIGVVAVIFESRPEAMPQILSLCLKTGNAILLKGGKEAERSNRILFETMQKAAVQAGVPAEAFALLESRADVNALLSAEGFVDLIIPRGSNDLVRYIQSNTKIPVLGHADGICHVYVDRQADLDTAIKITVDSKIQYPSACNAAETLLIHEARLQDYLPKILSALQAKGVELRLDLECLQVLEKLSKEKRLNETLDLGQIKSASDADWSCEYCEMIISVKAVSSLDEAIRHINKYGSGHTETMVTENEKSFEQFFAQVNSAGVYQNASTRFADGFRYGFGAEVGISTAKMHPRGPVGVEGLLSYKYKLLGAGHIVGDYSGPNAKSFTHRDLE